MMVIRSGEFGGRIFPADRCTWVEQVPTGGRGYSITNAFFYTGLSGTEGETATSIGDPELGFIGKSGRFVEISA